MRTIEKKISLEPMTSRLPSVWPAYYNDVLYYFDDDALKDREWQYTSNWGMVPMNVVVTPHPSTVLPNEEGEDKPLNDRKNYASAYTTSEGCHCYSGDYAKDMGCEVSGDVTYDELCCARAEDGLCEYIVLSFERLSKWYHFFNEYYNLLKLYGHCGRVYTSAEDYYNYESLTKYADQMIYGTDKQTYLDLDLEFADKGGKVEVLTFNKDTSEYSAMTPSQAHDEYYEKPNTDRLAMMDAYDVGFFKWICENVVPFYKIPKRYEDYWNSDRLFYPDVVRWLSWFSKRLGYEEYYVKGENGEVDTWDCKALSGDCCDCEEYFKRGGKRVFDEMCEWYNGIQNKILENKAVISGSETCFDATVILPTHLQVSIDDLGQFSIFSNEYKVGEDYRVAHYGDSANTLSGTVVTFDGKAMCLSQGSGFRFDATYMEQYVSSCKTDGCGYVGNFIDKCPKCGGTDIDTDWIPYAEFYINESDNGCGLGHKHDFYSSAYTFYAYDSDNVKHVSSASSLSSAERDIRGEMGVKYPLTQSDFGWILIDGELYEISESEYGVYDESNKYIGGNIYLVARDAFTNTPYTMVNGRRIYGEYNEVDNKFTFPFFKEGQEYTRFGDRKTTKYIDYNDHIYEVGDETSISGIDAYNTTYYKVDAYTYYDDGRLVYVKSEDKNPYFYNGTDYFDEKFSAATVDTKEGVLKVPYSGDITIYSVDEITGTTVSKLNGLRLYNLLTDDIGNTIEGVYPVERYNTKYHQPPQGHKLEPIYQVGNTANISRFSLTINDVDDIKDDSNHFVGDIITSMKFYYMTSDDTIPIETITEVVLEDRERVGTIALYGYRKAADSTESIPQDNVPQNGDGANTEPLNDEYERYEITSFTETEYTTLLAITNSTEQKEMIEQSSTGESASTIITFYEDIMCDVTYNIGATLTRKMYTVNSETNDTVTVGSIFFIENGDVFNKGVEYYESVRFVPIKREYYIKKGKSIEKKILPMFKYKVKNHSVSYPITAYSMVQNLEQVKESQYDSYYEVPIARFKTWINIFSDGEFSGGTYAKKKDMERLNGMEVFPTYREEYRLGSSSLENIDSNIYIERGINAAFEKHLKLGEVVSLEALVQYGNGYFKIMES